MSEDKRYNGWTNYETWNWALWMGNDEGSYNHASEIAQEVYDESEAGESYESQTRKEAAAYTLSERLKAECDEGLPDGLENGPYSDLLGAAISEINFYEIAEHLLEEVEEEMEAANA